MIKIYFPDINLEDTFDCGQCFRWDKQGERFVGVVGGEEVSVYKDGDFLCIESEKDEEFWKGYFGYDSPRPYRGTPLEEGGLILQKAMEVGKGIRILRQEPWETLISFIISQNNNIPRIKGIIKRLCENFGDHPVTLRVPPLQGRGIYVFPTPGELTGKDLSIIRAGFREKYILAAAEKCNGSFLQDIEGLPTDELREELMSICGVGPKIADCVMLFSFGRYEVFPKDVWIKRVMLEQFQVQNKDIDGYVEKHFGENAGYIQQYLFHYYRNIERNKT